MLSCQAGCPPSRGRERPGLRLSVRNFLAFRDARRAGFSASLTLDVMLFMLAALGFAVLADVDAYGGNILQPLGIHGGNPRQGGAHWKHHGYVRQAILEAGVPRPICVTQWLRQTSPLLTQCRAASTRALCAEP